MGRLFRMILNIVILAKIVDFIGFEKFGELTLLLTYQSYFAIMSTLGAEVNYGQTLVRGKYSDIFPTIFFIKLVITCFAMTALLGLSADKLLILSVLAGGLATLNLIDIQLSAQHLHQKLIKISLLSSIASFGIKISLIEIVNSETLLIYFLVLENLLISVFYLLAQASRVNFKVNTRYAIDIIKNSIQFVFQRLLFIMSTTLLLLLFSGRLDAIGFGQVSLSFKMVGFCYIVFAAMTSSFEKSIFGKIRKLESFSYMYRATFLLYFGIIALFPILELAASFSKRTSETIYLGVDNYIAIVLSLPYFLMVSLNKWYILNKGYRLIMGINVVVLASTALCSALVVEPSKFVFWVIWSASFSVGILAGFAMDNNRCRHFKVLRRSVWPLWKF